MSRFFLIFLICVFHCSSKEGKETIPASDITPPQELEFNLSSKVQAAIKSAEADADR